MVDIPPAGMCHAHCVWVCHAHLLWSHLLPTYVSYNSSHWQFVCLELIETMSVCLWHLSPWQPDSWSVFDLMFLVYVCYTVGLFHGKFHLISCLMFNWKRVCVYDGVALLYLFSLHLSPSLPFHLSPSRLRSLPFPLLFPGTNIANKDEVAIKLECVKTKHPQLHIEAKFYKIMQSGGGCGQYWWFYVYGMLSKNVCIHVYWLRPFATPTLINN